MAQIVLDYLKVILSSQVIIGIIIVFLAFQFKGNFKALIDRIAAIKLPGGGELSMPQKAKEKEEDEFSKNKLSVPEEDAPRFPGELKLNEKERNDLKEVFEAERAKSYLWEYRYLNYFLVHNTQKVLDWIISLPQRPTFALVDAVWTAVIPNANERQAMLAALEKHHLIQLKNSLIEVTPKGKEYAQWRGKI